MKIIKLAQNAPPEKIQTANPDWSLDRFGIMNGGQEALYWLNYNKSIRPPDESAFLEGVNVFYAQINPAETPPIFEIVNKKAVDRTRANMMDLRPFNFKGQDRLPANSQMAAADLGALLPVHVHGASGCVMKKSDFEALLQSLNLAELGKKFGFSKVEIGQYGTVDFKK